MLPLLLLAGLVLRPVDLGEPITDLRIADIDADGVQDIVAVSKEHLFLLRGGKGPAVKRAAPPLTVVGRGLFGIVRDGRYRTVKDPFGAWKEGEPGARSLLGALGRGEPAITESPGDLDGDGKDDPILSGPAGFHTPAGLVPVIPEAQLEIGRNEAFAVEYRIPKAVIGAWSGHGREIVFVDGGEVRAFTGRREAARVPLPLPTRGQDAGAIRRNQVFLRDVDGDGRLDMVVVMAKGKTELFAKFEATARFFLGGEIFNHDVKRFHRPKSTLKVSGVFLSSALLDVDGDRDLDLVLTTIDISIFSMATGTAPGNYHLFRFEDGAYQRKPAWTFRGPVPLSTFTEKPEPPVRFLGDLDGNHRPEALSIDGLVQIFEANGDGEFEPGMSARVEEAGRPAIGERTAAVPHRGGILIVEAAH